MSSFILNNCVEKMSGYFDETMELFGSSNDNSFNWNINDQSEESSDELEFYRGNNFKRLRMTAEDIKPERLPRRKPNPNVLNRNALMARENRRRKKEYVENLEKQLISYRCINKKLKKFVKKQQRLVEKLMFEKKYYQSLITNKSQVEALINAIEKTDIPVSISNSPVVSSTSIADNWNVDEDIADDFLTEDIFSDELKWHNLLGQNDVLNTPTQFNEFADEQSRLNLIKGFNNDHNYADGQKEGNDDDDDVGVCLHVSKGEVTLRFCSACQKQFIECDKPKVYGADV